MKIIEKTYKWANGLTKRKRTDEMILHHAAAKNCTADDIHSWHLARGWSGIAYHFLVRKDGSIYRGRPEDKIGGHTSGHNSYSIGICFEGDFEKEIMSDSQKKAGTELVAYLKNKYKISKVVKHKEYGNTACPGKNFPFNEIANGTVNNTNNNVDTNKNLVLAFQKAAVLDGFTFPKYGCDGKYGKETEDVMKKCVVKKRLIYTNKNTTKLVQEILGIKADGLCGNNTSNAIKKFQDNNNLEVDGCVGFNTWKVLLNIK